MCLWARKAITLQVVQFILVRRFLQSFQSDQAQLRCINTSSFAHSF